MLEVAKHVRKVVAGPRCKRRLPARPRTLHHRLHHVSQSFVIVQPLSLLSDSIHIILFCLQRQHFTNGTYPHPRTSVA